MKINLYRLLNISLQASPRQIAQSIDLAERLGTLEQKTITMARKVLLNPEMRAQYDIQVRKHFYQEISHSNVSISDLRRDNPFEDPSDTKNYHSLIEQSENEIKLYNTKTFLLLTLIGGPLAASYVIWNNYSKFNDLKSARIALIVGLFYFIIYTIGLTLTTPYHFILLHSFTIILAMILFKRFQGKYIKAHHLIGGEFNPHWPALKIGVITLLITLVTTLILALPINSLLYPSATK